ncbi:MAG TPA: TIGR02265 family protein [Holophagaceae bacterium]|nr:TIGR02265 family protein [Holophagaceae bacterium]
MLQEIQIPEGLTRVNVRIAAVRGPMTRQIRENVQRQGGEAAWQAMLAKVSRQCRECFAKPIGLYEWIPAELSSELSQAYMADADPEFTRRRGVDSARELITSINRWMLRLMTPSFLLENTPRMFSHYYMGGRVVLDQLGEGEARLSLWAEGFYPIWYEKGISGWLQGALELTGARGVEVAYEAPSGEGLLAFRHHYHVRWNS